MISRETIRLAYSFGLSNDYDDSKVHITYDYFSELYKLEFKDKYIRYVREDLAMSIDDFAERIIAPFIMNCLTGDLKFIHMDCS